MDMKKWHAVMIDETGCEFGAGTEAPDYDTAWDQLKEDYPESRIDVLKTESQWDEDQRARDWDAQAAYDEEWR